MNFTAQLQLLRSGHFNEMPAHFMRRHDPLDYLVIYVWSGHGFVESEGQRHVAKPGDLISLRAHAAHAYGADPRDPWDIFWAHFDGVLAGEFVAALREFGGLAVSLGLQDAVRERWVELVIGHGAAHPTTKIRDDTALAALLGLVLSRLQARTLAPEQTVPLDVGALHGYIHHHIRAPIALADLARVARLSPTHFARVFKAQFGASPVDYVIQKRVALACSLLRETAAPIKQVSESVGYADPYYFSRLFRQRTGLSPSAYRARRGG